MRELPIGDSHSQLRLAAVNVRGIDRCNRNAEFVHIFVFRDTAADQAHSESAAVKKFSSILYPECLAPVEFIVYGFIVSNI